jgi:hypothetical protein
VFRFIEPVLSGRIAIRPYPAKKLLLSRQKQKNSILSPDTFFIFLSGAKQSFPYFFNPNLLKNLNLPLVLSAEMQFF